MSQQHVMSREYKVMLLTSRFLGDEDELRKTAGTL